MKTVKNGNSYKRVTDSEANSLIRSGWSYCPKSEWKENVRDAGKTKEAPKSDKRKASDKKAKATAE